MSIHRVTISGLLWGQTCQNVAHFDNPDGTLTPAQIATEIYDNFLGHTASVGYQHVCGSVITFFQIKVEELASTPPSPYILSISRAGEVQAGNDVFGPVCLILQLRTPVGGRHGHGRLYIPAIVPNFVQNGIVHSNADAYIVQFLPALKDRFVNPGTGPLHLGVVRKGGTFADFIHCDDIQFSRRAGVQRRRGVGIGI